MAYLRPLWRRPVLACCLALASCGGITADQGSPLDGAVPDVHHANPAVDSSQPAPPDAGAPDRLSGSDGGASDGRSTSLDARSSREASVPVDASRSREASVPVDAARGDAGYLAPCTSDDQCQPGMACEWNETLPFVCPGTYVCATAPYESTKHCAVQTGCSCTGQTVHWYESSAGGCAGFAWTLAPMPLRSIGPCPDGG